MFRMCFQGSADDKKRELLDEVETFIKTMERDHEKETESLAKEAKRVNKDLFNLLEKEKAMALQKKDAEMQAALRKKDEEFQVEREKHLLREKELLSALEKERLEKEILEFNRDKKQFLEMKEELEAYRVKVMDVGKYHNIEKEFEMENKTTNIKENKPGAEDEADAVHFLLKKMLLISEGAITSLETEKKRMENELSSLYTVVNEMMAASGETPEMIAEIPETPGLEKCSTEKNMPKELHDPKTYGLAPRSGRTLAQERPRHHLMAELLRGVKAVGDAEEYKRKDSSNEELPDPKTYNWAPRSGRTLAQERPRHHLMAGLLRELKVVGDAVCKGEVVYSGCSRNSVAAPENKTRPVNPSCQKLPQEAEMPKEAGVENTGTRPKMRNSHNDQSIQKKKYGYEEHLKKGIYKR